MASEIDLRIQRTLLPEKYASMTRPVFAVIALDRFDRDNSLQKSAVRRHCHTIAGATGFPVLRSQTMVVSRWLVMPIAWMVFLLAANNRRAESSCAPQISAASCSTHPGC